jgi:hypothetical protein
MFFIYPPGSQKVAPVQAFSSQEMPLRCFAAAELLTHHPRMGTAALPKIAPAFTYENVFAINALSVRRIHPVRPALRV